MSSPVLEISRNILQGDPDLRFETIASLDSPTFMHGGRYATLILPEYAATFREGVSRIMAGIALSRNALTKLPNGTEAFASIFGYQDAGFVVGPEQYTRILIPSIAKDFLPFIEGDPNDALHGYHSQLVAETNVVLNALASPYRLTPLPTTPT